MGKLKLFPSSFLSQQELGKSKIYRYASTKTQPATMYYVGERIITYKGKQQKFLLYEVSPGDFESGPYLGMAGPYSLDSKDYNSSQEATGVYRDKVYDVKKLDVFLDEYLLSLEKEEKEFKEMMSHPPPKIIK
jgi:hypothetical protein